MRFLEGAPPHKDIDIVIDDFETTSPRYAKRSPPSDSTTSRRPRGVWMPWRSNFEDRADTASRCWPSTGTICERSSPLIPGATEVDLADRRTSWARSSPWARSKVAPSLVSH